MKAQFAVNAVQSAAYLKALRIDVANPVAFDVNGVTRIKFDVTNFDGKNMIEHLRSFERDITSNRKSATKFLIQGGTRHNSFGTVDGSFHDVNAEAAGRGGSIIVNGRADGKWSVTLAWY